MAIQTNKRCPKTLLHTAMSTVPEVKLVGDSDINFHYHPNAISSLYRTLQEKFSHTTRAYHTVNLWRQLIWQPIYLSVASCYRAKISTNLHELKQVQTENTLYGLLVTNIVTHHTLQHAINANIHSLRRCLDHAFNTMKQACHLSYGQSVKIVCDILANAFVRVSGIAQSDELTAALSEWQHALFNKQHTFLHTERNTLKIKLATCCLHVQIEPNNPCKNCPKNFTRRTIHAN